jgi:cell division protease FtsH
MRLKPAVMKPRRKRQWVSSWRTGLPSSSVEEPRNLRFDDVVSTGASDDLEKATELARQMVTRFGMSGRLGQITYGHAMTNRFLRMPFTPEERNYSERTAEAIDDEIRALMDGQYQRVRQILEQRAHELETIVGELIRKETLERTELEALIEPAPVPAPTR